MRSRGLRSILAAGVVYVCVTGAISLHAAQDATTPPTSLASTGLPANATGEEIFRATCATCHGLDGRGSPQTVVAFDVGFPDFTDCSINTVEPFADWSAVVHRGGPIRGLDHHMPAFGDALSDAQIETVIKYLWTFCRNASWPRGDLNFPRAFFTEKAYPENEAIWTSGVTTRGQKAVANDIQYEHRIGTRGQYEINVPINFQQATAGQSWAHGFGDIEVALRRSFIASLEHTAIFAAGGAVTLPTGSESSGLGGGVTIWEPFAMFGKGLGANGFLQMHAGVELPTDKTKAPNEAFLRTALGYSFAQDQGFGRAWTPMAEVLFAREFGGEPEIDVVPQMQVSLSKLQHVLLNVGVRVPVTERAGRHPQVLTYFLWDWFDGGLFQFWR